MNQPQSLILHQAFIRLFSCVAVVSLVILLGCQNQPIDPYHVPANSQQVTASQQQVSLADQANYEAALKLNDAAYCNKILASSYRDQCKTELSDGAQLVLALSKKDSSACDKLSTEDKKQACKTRLEVLIKEAQTQQQQDQAIQADQKKVAEFIEKKDYASCKTLQLSSSEYDCELNILSNLAIQSKDIKICDKASDKQVQADCQNLFKSSQPK